MSGEFRMATPEELEAIKAGLIPIDDQPASAEAAPAQETAGADPVAAAFEKAAAEPYTTGTPEEEAGEEAPKGSEVLPDVVTFDMDDVPELRKPLIEGVLREGDTLALTGASKSGKSWAAMGLAVSVAIGSDWLGFECHQGRVLYIDGELHEESALNRFRLIAKRRGLSSADLAGRIDVLPLRGYDAETIRTPGMLVDCIAYKLKGTGYRLAIIDPAYIFMDGDENTTEGVRPFLRALNRLGEDLGCSIAYVHHHSKGAQGAKAAIDRAAGSGTFARHYDAGFDFTELVPREEDLERYGLGDDTAAFRVEVTLRDFPRVKPFDVWFKPPIHIRDYEGVLSELDPMSPERRGGKLTGKRISEQNTERWASAEDKLEAHMRREGMDAIQRKQAMKITGYSDISSFMDRIDGNEARGIKPSARFMRDPNSPKNCCIITLREDAEQQA